jgi:hypothetical protein
LSLGSFLSILGPAKRGGVGHINEEIIKVKYRLIENTTGKHIAKYNWLYITKYNCLVNNKTK